MKKEIEQGLLPLVTEPLSHMWRFSGFQIFEFGVQKPEKNRRGEDITMAEKRLHVSCEWSLSGREGRIVSSDDFVSPSDRRDGEAHLFYAMLHEDPPVVENIQADDRGEVVLSFSRGYSLRIEPDLDLYEPDEELWRYLSESEDSDFCVYPGSIWRSD